MRPTDLVCLPIPHVRFVHGVPVEARFGGENEVRDRPRRLPAELEVLGDDLCGLRIPPRVQLFERMADPLVYLRPLLGQQAEGDRLLDESVPERPVAFVAFVLARQAI